jgi:hypothetical protein
VSDKKLEAWMGSREPPVPSAFLPYLALSFTAAEGGEEIGRGRLTESGIAALEHALGRPGRDRAAAFHLLAADALVTYACEEAALENHPAEALTELLNRIGEAFP